MTEPAALRAEELDTLNRQRRSLQEDMQTQALAQAEAALQQLPDGARAHLGDHPEECLDGVDLAELPEPPTHRRVQNLGGGRVRIARPPTAIDTLGLVGDAATRIKQTLMFDLPIVDKAEVQALMRADLLGGGKRTSR